MKLEIELSEKHISALTYYNNKSVEENLNKTLESMVDCYENDVLDDETWELIYEVLNKYLIDFENNYTDKEKDWIIEEIISKIKELIYPITELKSKIPSYITQ